MWFGQRNFCKFLCHVGHLNSCLKREEFCFPQHDLEERICHSRKVQQMLLIKRLGLLLIHVCCASEWSFSSVVMLPVCRCFTWAQIIRPDHVVFLSCVLLDVENVAFYFCLSELFIVVCVPHFTSGSNQEQICPLERLQFTIRFQLLTLVNIKWTILLQNFEVLEATHPLQHTNI